MPDLTTAADLANWLGLQGNTQDATLASLVTAVSAAVEQYCNRVFASATYSETRNGTGRTVLFFGNMPVTAVASVLVDGSAIPARPAPGSAGYSFDAEALYLEGYCFTRGRQNVQLQYTAGFASIPVDVAQATLELCALRWKEHDRIGLTSKAQQGETTAYLVRDIPVQVRTTLDQWRRVVVP